MFLAVAAYQQLAEACDYPLHLGITEAGGLRGGTVKSSIGMGSLLWAGIGDTIRVSLSADPVEEIKVGFDMLKSLGLRRRGVTVISCPSCARQNFDVIKTVEMMEERLAHITTPMTLSIIGCVVNGPGEARETDIGFTGGGNNTHQVYMSGGDPAHRSQGPEHRRPSGRAGRKKGRRDRSRRQGRRRSPSPSSMAGLQPVRGTQDLLPDAHRRHRAVIETARGIAERYGYREIATPVFEFTEVFARPIGVTSDIVSKEMYSFTDRGGEEITLRPEYTAGIVRAVHRRTA